VIDPLAEVLARLRARGTEPRRSGAGWSARCPAHDDRSPSLSIASGSDGRVLLYCHAGCRFDEIASALGMATKELFPPETCVASSWRKPRPMPLQLRRVTPTSAPVPAKAKKAAPRIFNSWETAIGTSFGRPTATWLYRNATGQVVGVVARFREGATGKTFRQASLGDKGTWTATGMPKPRPLYRLPDLLASHGTIYVSEGEKCADALAAIGMVATTSIGGASNSHHSDWTPLAGRRVVIFPDADEQGAKYASDVAVLARVAGAAEVRIVSIAAIWPEVPLKGDIADWIAACPLSTPEMLHEEVERRVADAPLSPVASLPSIICSGRTSGPPLEFTNERRHTSG
jgi:hypothetical protein